MPGKFQERDVFFAPVVEHANRAHFFVADPCEFASRAAELAVKRLHPPRRRVEMLLEKFFENVHQDADPSVKIAWLRASVVIPPTLTKKCHPEPSRVLRGLREGSAFAFAGRAVEPPGKSKVCSPESVYLLRHPVASHRSCEGRKRHLSDRLRPAKHDRA